MKLPNHARAVVSPKKITDYLLSFTHEDGKSKAEFFTRFGFRAEEWEQLANALVNHATENEVAATERSAFGTRFIIEGIIRTPDGRNPSIRAIWFIENGENSPRFVSAYPLKRSTK